MFNVEMLMLSAVTATSFDPVCRGGGWTEIKKLHKVMAYLGFTALLHWQFHSHTVY